MSRANTKGRPAPRRRPAASRSRVAGWAGLVSSWFTVAVIAGVAVWYALPAFRGWYVLATTADRDAAEWATAVLYTGACAGALCMSVAAVRAASPSLLRLSDGTVRRLVGVGLLLVGLTMPLLLMRLDVTAVALLILYYARLRRELAAILPAWLGGTWRSEQKRRTDSAAAVKRPPRAWDPEPDDVPEHTQTATRGPRRRHGKKKRRGGR